MESLGKNIHQCLEHHFIIFEHNGLVSVASIACVYMYTHARTKTHRERVYVCACACVNTNNIKLYVCIFNICHLSCFSYSKTISQYIHLARGQKSTLTVEAERLLMAYLNAVRRTRSSSAPITGTRVPANAWQTL